MGGREFRAFVGRSAAYGGILWLAAALFVHWTRPLFFDAKAPLSYTVALFVLSIPATFAMVQPVRWYLGDAAKSKVQLSVATATATACVLDGTAMLLMPDALYGGAGDGLGKGAAWILWGAGWGLFWTIDEDSFHGNLVPLK